MTLVELLRFIKEENVRLRAKYGQSADDEKWAYSQAVKMTEELGELCSEILASHSMQRPEKLSTNQHERLNNEFADVIIASLLTAETMGVDIEAALKRKIAIIKQRHA